MVSLSTNASLNFSAMDNSAEFESCAGVALGIDPRKAHVLGSISSTTGSSSAISGNASVGTLVPLNPKGEGLGFTMMRGHSVEKLSNVFLSIFGCKREET